MFIIAHIKILCNVIIFNNNKILFQFTYSCTACQLIQKRKWVVFKCVCPWIWSRRVLVFLLAIVFVTMNLHSLCVSGADVCPKLRVRFNFLIWPMLCLEQSEQGWLGLWWDVGFVWLHGLRDLSGILKWLIQSVSLVYSHVWKILSVVRLHL